jgi:DNA (cytosine-5)-methyltransferase 1
MPSKTDRIYQVLSLFSGAGGLDLGFTGGFTYLGQYYYPLPFRIVRAYDLDPKAVATYNANLEPVCQIEDVTLLNPEDLPKDIDVILGGFPCQDFSLLGSRRGITVYRGQLYRAMVRMVEALAPKIFVAENVKGLLSANGGLAKKIITEDFANAGPGYLIYMQVLNAADYGVPQKRERVIIVGVRNDLPTAFEFPKPTHLNPIDAFLTGMPEWRTVRDALQDIEDPVVHDSLPNSEWDKRRFFPNWNMDRVLSPHEPSPTIVTKQPPFHYKHDRRLSVRECARIQGFPDSFVFKAAKTDAYRLVGNAVPPVLGWHIAKAVSDFLLSLDYELHSHSFFA